MFPLKIKPGIRKKLFRKENILTGWEPGHRNSRKSAHTNSRWRTFRKTRKAVYLLMEKNYPISMGKRIKFSSSGGVVKRAALMITKKYKSLPYNPALRALAKELRKA